MNIQFQSAVSTQETQPTQPTQQKEPEKNGQVSERPIKDDIELSNTYNSGDEASAVEAIADEENKAEAKALSREEVVKVAQQLQDFVESLNRNVRFSIDEESGRDVISVVEVDSGELIRQIPSEEVLKLASRISKAAGLIVQEKV